MENVRVTPHGFVYGSEVTYRGAFSNNYSVNGWVEEVDESRGIGVRLPNSEFVWAALNQLTSRTPRE